MPVPPRCQFHISKEMKLARCQFYQDASLAIAFKTSQKPTISCYLSLLA
ncbi:MULTISPECIES: hypothetical protein [unclassified Moorena]|nr:MULTISPECIES: hypothetical protein [unclassified Moorena]NEO23747.1 hypothetical protein [Moorena sp. SIO4A5]NEQ56936.1 hypothetical protein [Moorena sp. SIO4A1]